MTPDYSLYLVTDSTMVPETSTFLAQVEKAVENGATIVQLREKSISTLDFIERAKSVLQITRPRGVPLIINDRIDVALAVGAEGVHVGQDDMPATMVRKIIGPDMLLGVSCGNVKETEQVITEGVADYVGLGTLYPTNTKNVKCVCGPIGVRRLLAALAKHNIKSERKIRCVAIGGINHSNVAKVLFQCSVKDQKLDGVAIVSCIMAAADAAEATRSFEVAINSPVSWLKGLSHEEGPNTKQSWTQMKKAKPLVHHITNNVVKNFSANVTLAIGASPIMSEFSDEFVELAALPNNALVINLGTPTPEAMAVYLRGLAAYNKAGRPVVFDPVAAGATKARLEACRTLLNAGHFSLIKGNVGEIMALRQLFESPTSHQKLMQGVDSIVELNEKSIGEIGQAVATEFHTVVVITGKDNYICTSEGVKTNVEGGHEFMGSITGTGCSLGSVIGAFLAAGADGRFSENYNAASAVAGALQLYNDAGKVAGDRAIGPGEFMSNFLDLLYLLVQ